MNKQLRYKFIHTGMKSENGDLVWKLNQWVHHPGKLDMCRTGLHCSLYPDQAFSFVQGEILALVETKGKFLIQDDKECWSDMRVVKAYKWQKKDSVALAIYAAELVIDIFEKEYPHDDRPRKAIEAAKVYLKHPTKKNMEAARGAASGAASEAASWAARAARAASGAASWAASEASVASWAASVAAGEAARAARAASWAASAASVAIIKSLRSWMLKRIRVLESYKP